MGPLPLLNTEDVKLDRFQYLRWDEILTTVLLNLLVYHYLAKKYHYFLSKPIPCVKPSILVGSSGPLLFRKRDLATHIKIMYNAFPDAKVVGMYDLTSPMYMLRDPDMIKKLYRSWSICDERQHG